MSDPVLPAAAAAAAVKIDFGYTACHHGIHTKWMDLMYSQMASDTRLIIETRSCRGGVEKFFHGGT